MEEFFKKRKGFWWSFIWETILMFSSRPSLFSAKRVERFALFALVYWMLNGYIVRNWEKLTTEEVLMIAGTLLTTGILNSIQIRKDALQANSQSNGTTENKGAIQEP